MNRLSMKIKSALANAPFTGVVALAMLTGATAVAAHAQNFSVIRSLGLTSSEPSSPTNAGVMAQGRDGFLYSTSSSGGAQGYGTVYKVSPTGTLSVIYSFDNTHGATPNSGLTLGSDGNFYGTTFAGGSSNVGTIFKVTPAGALTVLYNFRNQGDGAAPWAPPIQGTDGNFYGTTAGSGYYGDGAIYKLTSAGKYSVLHSFRASDGAYPESALLQASDGNLYGVTYAGGSAGSGAGVLFRISTSGAYSVLHNFDGPNGADPYGALIQARDGNLYGTTNRGGAFSANGTIFKFALNGSVLTVLHSFGSGADGIQPYAGLVQASDGNFYGATYQGGTSGYYGSLFKLTAAGAYSTLHNFNGNDGVEGLPQPMQHTGGNVYGETYQGGSAYKGEVYALSGSLPAFVQPLFNSGAVGSTVQILGQGFSSSSIVSFGGKAATSIQATGSTFLTAVVPSGALTGPLTVKTGSTTLSSNQSFRVLPVIQSFTPSGGAQGTQVVITGSGLTQTQHVAFGGVNATSVTVNSDSKVTAVVPSGAKTGKITITTPGGIATSASTYTY